MAVREIGDAVDGFFHCYRDHSFNKRTVEMLKHATAIVDDMRSQGFKLTLRQLYYQLVTQNLIENTNASYKKLGRIVTHARESGRMDWLAIEDRGRNAYGPVCEERPDSLVKGIEDGLKFSQWDRQEHYLEVWVEKQALEAVVARPCNRLDVVYMACKGYLSASEAWRAGQRYSRRIADGKKPVLIHLADHDPSGLNMTEDNQDRVRIFAEDLGIEVRRIALNMDQVKKYKPPENPAKEKDSRFADYKKRYGVKSWELDALSPKVLDDLITGTINEYRDTARWDQTLIEEEAAKAPLAALSDNWDAIKTWMSDQGMY
jgi:hypothetical protein